MQEVSDAYLVIPGQDNPQPNNKGKASNPKKINLKWLILTGALLVIIVFLLFISYSLSKKNKTLEATNKNQENGTNLSSIPLPTQSPISVDDPLKEFKTQFFRSSYVVKIIGSFFIGKTNLLFNDNSKYYFNKGTLVRAEANGSDNDVHAALVSNDSNLYTLDITKQTYSKLQKDNSDPFKSTIYNSIYFKYSMPLVQLMDDSSNLKWEKIGDFEYQTNWVYKIMNQSIATKINLGPDNLLSSLSLKFTENGPWQTIAFYYQPLASLEPVLGIPSNYKLTQ